ncbi:MAG: hypothetical protein ASARMPREDX12_000358 [Alectoria sarmentosa]|nr:MAG: hypothetical protein ASARMPRED_005028 [Alectoria sarmentosa]CAD6581104.1 MAG: hypothetical protein ASARMPREDX12_000358 [Alectoria sarmentosa]
MDLLVAPKSFIFEYHEIISVSVHQVPASYFPPVLSPCTAVNDIIFGNVRVMAVARRIQHFNGTHFLGLPLYNSKSRSQLESFTHTLRNDEYAKGIPPRIFRLPTAFHLNVADLRLETNHDVEAASKMLHRLDIQRILKNAAASTATAKTSDQLDERDEQSKTRIDFESSVPPLRMSLKGIEGGKGGKTLDSGKILGLYGTISEAPARFRGFVRGVRREFASAGFKLWAGGQNNEQDYVEFKSLQYLLLNPRGARTMKTFVADTGSVVIKPRDPEYDVKPLLQRYENVEIVKDLIIEKLSLFKEGRKRTFRGDKNEFVVDEYYEEIDSIPLPQE